MFGAVAMKHPKLLPAFRKVWLAVKATVSAGKNQSALPSGLTVAGSNWKSRARSQRIPSIGQSLTA